MLAWREVDNVFLIQPYATKVKGLCFSIKIRIYAVVMFCLVICNLKDCFPIKFSKKFLFSVDHFMFMYSAIDRNQREIEYCDPNKRDFWKNFFVSER